MTRYRMNARALGDSRLPMTIGPGGEFDSGEDMDDLVELGVVDRVESKVETIKTKVETPQVAEPVADEPEVEPEPEPEPEPEAEAEAVDPRSIVCPRCGAQPGEACHDDNGRSVRTHKLRVEAAAA